MGNLSTENHDKTLADDSGPAKSPPAALRVVFLADHEVLRCYGPVLKRLAVGLLDEVNDLSILSLGPSKFLRYVPSPPVRLITETRSHQSDFRFDITARQTTISAGQSALFDKLWPHYRLARLANSISLYKPTLLHALSEKHAHLAQHISKILGINYVVSMLAIDSISLAFNDPRCGAILCSNSALARKIRHNQPHLASRVHIQPIGTHVPDEPCCFSRPSGTSVIFCCSPLEYGYGLTTLINALKRLSQKGAQPLLFLSGHGSAEHDLFQQVKQLSLQNQVHFIPPPDVMLSVSDAYQVVLREADIFVQPQPVRFWQPELLEAMSVGNAVVAADGKNNDLIIDNKTALSVPFQDEQALTDSLLRLLQDHNYACSLACSAQQHLRKHFLVSHMISQLTKTYRQALQI